MLARMVSRSVRLALGWILASLLVGCATVQETVEITSLPPRAEVFIDGTYRGVTPLALELPTLRSHRVELRAPGYRPAVSLIASTPNEKADHTVKFGLLVDAGYYRTLEPNPANFELVSDLVPASKGTDAFAEFGDRALELDKRLARGEIAAAEHARILAQLIVFFE